MESQGLAKVVTHGLSRPLRARPGKERHDAPAKAAVGALEQCDGDRYRSAGRAERPVVRRNRPWVWLQVIDERRQCELDFAEGADEAARVREVGHRLGLALLQGLLVERLARREELHQLLRRDLLGTAEDPRF